MSEYIEIAGGVPLHGTVQVAGAKNAVLPMLIASILTPEPCIYENVPAIADVSLTIQLLRQLGGHVEYSPGCIEVRVPEIASSEASYSLVKAMRASFWVLGALLGRCGKADVALPGGDIIGSRPVDMHLAALGQMGAEFKIRNGIVQAEAPNGLRPATITLRGPSVGATHQIILAAASTPGTTVIENAAREPEVSALADLINQMGGDVEGAGTSIVVIRGVSELHGARVRLIGDRIEAATYLLAAAASAGSVKVEGFDPEFLGRFTHILTGMGLDLELGADFVALKSTGILRPVQVVTGPFPELATDIQAPLMALLCLAGGRSSVEETVFDGRFGHVPELCRMGARIEVNERIAAIDGISRFSSAPVEAFDIRGAVALVVAAVAAEGVTKIFEPHHIRRGYENLVGKLRSLGARTSMRLSDPEDFLYTGC